jgi:hypothetical protein
LASIAGRTASPSRSLPPSTRSARPLRVDERRGRQIRPATIVRHPQARNPTNVSCRVKPPAVEMMRLRLIIRQRQVQRRNGRGGDSVLKWQTIRSSALVRRLLHHHVNKQEHGVRERYSPSAVVVGMTYFPKKGNRDGSPADAFHRQTRQTAQHFTRQDANGLRSHAAGH